MKLGIVGFSGYVRRAYIPYLKVRTDIELSAICDVLGSKKLGRIIAEAGVNSHPRIFNELQTMLASAELDAVIISTPHIFHFEQVKVCLEAGLHVMVDKPLACQAEDAEILVKISEGKDLRLAVGNQRRYERPYQYVKQAIQQKHLGEISLVSYLFANSPWYDYSQSWRGDPSLSGGGALIDIGHLAVDMVVWLLDRPLYWVYAMALTPSDKRVEQSVSVMAGFEPDILVNLTISYEAPMPSVQEEMSIYGSEGSIFTRRFRTIRSTMPPEVIEQFRNGEVRNISFTEGPDSSNPLDDFLQSIEKNVEILSDGESNLRTVEFIDAAYRSIQEHKRINLRDR